MVVRTHHEYPAIVSTDPYDPQSPLYDKDHGVKMGIPSDFCDNGKVSPQSRLDYILAWLVCIEYAKKRLFISYKFVKGFLAITFLLLVFLNWNFQDVCQRFIYSQKRNFSLILQKTKIFPIDPHYKNRPLL